MQPRLAPAVPTVLGIVLAASLIGCSHGNDYYHRDPYANANDKKIDSGLASAEKELTRLLATRDARQILLERTAPPMHARMVRFVHGYAGHPTAIARVSPGDDATADEALLVTCRPGHVQQVILSWAWFDGAWRAWPDYALTATGKTVEYPGCR
jgi:hypothetical protein